MATAGAWFLPSGQEAVEHAVQQPRQAGQPAHRSWPTNSKAAQAYRTLKDRLARNEGRGCAVEVFELRYPSGPDETLLWSSTGTCHSEKELLEVVLKRKDQKSGSTLYIATALSAEAIQILGHYFDLMPRFFSTEYTPLITGPICKQYMFLGLQFMDKYVNGRKPLEAYKSDDSIELSFASDKDTGAWWRVTQMSFICLRSHNGEDFDVIMCADAGDESLLQSLRHLIQSSNQGLFAAKQLEDTNGPGQLINEFFFLVSYCWNSFLQEAEDYLQKKAAEIARSDEGALDLDVKAILELTQELHRLAPVWVEVRRRISFAIHAIEHVLQHPIIAETSSPEFRGFMNTRHKTLEDRLERAKELTEETKVLISLILNLTTLKDARQAMKQNEFSIEMQNRIQKITVLTFLYLPLTFVSSCFGMNVSEINGSIPSVWIYVVLAVGFTSLTFGIWYGWSLLSKIKKKLLGGRPGKKARNRDVVRDWMNMDSDHKGDVHVRHINV